MPDEPARNARRFQNPAVLIKMTHLSSRKPGHCVRGCRPPGRQDVYAHSHATVEIMNVRKRWWQLNYHALRLAVIKPSKVMLRMGLQVEGRIPDARPVMLAPVHRTSVDTFAISYAIGDMISYVSTDSFGHSRVANAVQKWLTTALGSIIWEQRGIPNSRMRAIALARAFEQRLDHRLIVAAFTQGKYQPHSVDSIEDGLIGLLRRYEVRLERQSGHGFKIPIVPVGIEYDYEGRGLEYARTADVLAKYIPYFPRWTSPALGSKITVRFGEPHYFGELSTEDLTRTVMREAARLSNIPFNVDSGQA